MGEVWGAGVSVQLLVLAVAVAAVVAPLLVDQLERWVRSPSVVVEIVLGILVGPHLLGLVQAHLLFETVSQLGLASCSSWRGLRSMSGRCGGGRSRWRRWGGGCRSLWRRAGWRSRVRGPRS
ncbi:cation:proton antiporter [Glycomyces luteolus]|uniref:Cation:proton antiporter n=1 Tax=Glycomyces luteolus TaxID=2670330 RepID=A0A9X3SRQ7_9ACTN|nr:cation:proton antiporter [Glycomyces luteolus]MDA1360164.1 cation:proton antiporter [Glycomyces luteolus]